MMIMLADRWNMPVREFLGRMSSKDIAELEAYLALPDYVEKQEKPKEEEKVLLGNLLQYQTNFDQRNKKAN